MLEGKSKKRQLPGAGDGKDISPDMIDALRKGDHGAFEHIYLHYSRSLTLFLTSLTQSKEDAQEITQEVFIALWNNREVLEPEKGLRRYIFHLAKFRAFDLFDHRRVREKYQDMNKGEEECTFSTDEIIIEKETALLLKHAMSRMPVRQKEVFLLKREEEMSYEEISGKLGISVNTVKFHMKNALRELRGMFK